MERRAEIHDALSSALNDIDGDRSPLELVGDIPHIEEALDAIVAERVDAARGQGLSWEAIAQKLGISRQAAHKRFVKGKRKRTKRGQAATINLKIERQK